MSAEMGVPGPDVEHHRHHGTGHRWLDITFDERVAALRPEPVKACPVPKVAFKD